MKVDLQRFLFILIIKLAISKNGLMKVEGSRLENEHLPREGRSFPTFYPPPRLNESHHQNLTTRDEMDQGKPKFEGPKTDFLGIQVIKQIWTDTKDEVVKKASLDPLILFPMNDVPVRKKGYFSGEMTACDMYLHNLKSARLREVDVQRQNMEKLHATLKFYAPIVWITGYYKLLKGKFFGFIPSKDRRGHFNIDLKHVRMKIEVDVDLHSNSTTGLEVSVDRMKVRWNEIEIKFDNIAGRFTTMADLTLNQLGLGNKIALKQKENIEQELKIGAVGISKCLLEHSSILEQCIIDFWVSLGYEYPWVYPKCY